MCPLPIHAPNSEDSPIDSVSRFTLPREIQRIQHRKDM